MGTRADFYIGRGKDAKWVGSIAWDGYPDGICLTTDKQMLDMPGVFESEEFPKRKHLFHSKTEKVFLSRLEQFFKNRKDVTRPESGWPWPWNDSHTTDYAYAFDPKTKTVWATFGTNWFKASGKEPDYENRSNSNNVEFPDMSKVKNVTLGAGSGLIIIGG
jgi:hypothetical protein